MPRRAPARRPRRPVRRMRPRRRVVRKPRSEFATAKQTLQLNDDAFGIVWNYYSVALDRFDRLKAIAENYQYFRITMVEMKFKPYADTYLQDTGVGTPQSIPYFYWLINRGENSSFNSFDELRDAGSKPIRFDDKTIVVRYKPSVLLANLQYDASGVPISTFNSHRISPWLSTNKNAGLINPNPWQANETQHFGLLYGCEQDSSTGSNNVYGVEVTVHMEFKKPASALDKSSVPAQTKETIRKSEVVV